MIAVVEKCCANILKDLGSSSARVFHLRQAYLGHPNLRVRFVEMPGIMTESARLGHFLGIQAARGRNSLRQRVPESRCLLRPAFRWSVPHSSQTSCCWYRMLPYLRSRSVHSESAPGMIVSREPRDSSGEKQPGSIPFTAGSLFTTAATLWMSLMMSLAIW